MDTERNFEIDFKVMVQNILIKKFLLIANLVLNSALGVNINFPQLGTIF